MRLRLATCVCVGTSGFTFWAQQRAHVIVDDEFRCDFVFIFFSFVPSPRTELNKSSNKTVVCWISIRSKNSILHQKYKSRIRCAFDGHRKKLIEIELILNDIKHCLRFASSTRCDCWLLTFIKLGCERFICTLFFFTHSATEFHC